MSRTNNGWLLQIRSDQATNTTAVVTRIYQMRSLLRMVQHQLIAVAAISRRLSQTPPSTITTRRWSSPMQWQHPDSVGSQRIGRLEAARKSRSEHCPAGGDADRRTQHVRSRTTCLRMGDIAACGVNIAPLSTRSHAKQSADVCPYPLIVFLFVFVAVWCRHERLAQRFEGEKIRSAWRAHHESTTSGCERTGMDIMRLIRHCVAAKNAE